MPGDHNRQVQLYRPEGRDATALSRITRNVAEPLGDVIVRIQGELYRAEIAGKLDEIEADLILEYEFGFSPRRKRA